MNFKQELYFILPNGKLLLYNNILYYPYNNTPIGLVNTSQLNTEITNIKNSQLIYFKETKSIDVSGYGSSTRQGYSSKFNILSGTGYTPIVLCSQRASSQKSINITVPNNPNNKIYKVDIIEYSLSLFDSAGYVGSVSSRQNSTIGIRTGNMIMYYPTFDSTSEYCTSNNQSLTISAVKTNLLDIGFVVSIDITDSSLMINISGSIDMIFSGIAVKITI